MNPQIKTVLLTVLTLSFLTIAIIELSGISSTALFHKYGINMGHHPEEERINEDLQKEKERREEINSLPKTRISFEEAGFDFGKVKEGEIVSHTYRFTNTGEFPLLISDVIPSCGCTIPTFSKTPIQPGEKGEIRVEFNSSNRKGLQKKNILVVSNAEEAKTSIHFQAEVE